MVMGLEWSGVEWSGIRLPFHMLSVKSLVCGLWSDLFVEMQRERFLVACGFTLDFWTDCACVVEGCEG